jgi:peptide/nickel transport system substrate-binding protein
MFRHRARASTALAIVIGMLLAACGGGGGDAGSGGSANGSGEPQSGGSLVYLHTLEPRSLDPIALTGATSASGDGQHALAIYDTLMYEDAETNEVTMQIAESFTSDDATVWTLELKPDVSFSDGTPYDAEAVQFNWERQMSDESVNLSAASAIESMDVVDPQTLRVTLREPNGQFPRLVAKQLGFIGSPTAIEAEGDQFGNEPVGAGPYLVESWTRGGDLTMTRNPDYWNAPLPYLDELVIRAAQEGDQRYNAFAAGEADIATLHAAYNVLPRAEQEGHHVERLETGGGTQWVFNMTEPPFDDVRVRRAFSLGVDRADYNEVVNQGAGDVPETLFPEGSPFHYPDVTYPEPDPDEAQSLFDEVADETGEPVTFTLLASLNTSQTAEYWQQQLSQFDNVEVEVEVIDPREVFTQISGGDFQVATFGTALVDPEPDLFNAYHTDEQRNFGGYSDPEMDEALATGRASLDPDERRRAYETVAELEVRDVPVVYIQRMTTNLLVAEGVHDLAFAGAGIPLWDRIWVSE